jgi:hypothetical protein
MGAPVESQFEDYCGALVSVLGHTDRHEPASSHATSVSLLRETVA